MQLTGNNFCWDVVLDSFKMVYIDEDSIYEQKFVTRTFWDLYYEDFKF